MTDGRTEIHEITNIDKQWNIMCSKLQLPKNKQYNEREGGRLRKISKEYLEDGCVQDEYDSNKK